jgi:hypothetical protein
MEDSLAQIEDLVLGRVVSISWLTGLLGLMAIYAFGYLCGILPSLLGRRRRRAQEQSAALCAEILERICRYEELYDRYIRDPDPSKGALLAKEIAAVGEDLRQLESRLAELEQRGSRKLPLRPLPVRQLEIE